MKIPLLFLILFICSCSHKAMQQPIKILQEKVQEITEKLDKFFFNGACPQDIKVISCDGNYCSQGGGFIPNQNIIALADHVINNDIVVAHETCHLCLYHLTKGNSNKEEFRFFDEGWASIVEGNFNQQYKIDSINKTKEKIKAEEISFKKVQKWKTYFGGSGTGKYDWSAYNVGTSFVYFILDTYSKKQTL